jgi:hypothetical protein
MAKAEKHISGQGGRGSQNNPPKADQSSILDYFQAQADAVSALLREPGGGELMANAERQRAAERGARSYPTTAPPARPAPPSEEPKRKLRRRHSKYPWNEICAEIAARCIDPKTRCVDVPKNERKLAERILQWCVDNDKPQPVESEMREAVKAVCVRLRKI